MKRIIMCVFAIFCMVSFSSCDNDSVPPEVREIYVSYLEQCKIDQVTAAKEYCYFRTVDWDVFSVSANENRINGFEVLNWEKLNEKLWVATTHIDRTFNSRDFYHYVAIVDGKYCVMLNKNDIPDDIKENVDFSRFSYDYVSLVE